MLALGALAEVVVLALVSSDIVGLVSFVDIVDRNDLLHIKVVLD